MYATEDSRRTEATLRYLIQVQPSRFDAYGMLADLYVEKRRVGRARAKFERLVALDRTSVSANTMLGLLLHLEGRQSDAERQYERVLALDARAPVAANNLAWLFVSTNRNLDRALRLARIAHEQLPREPHVNDTLGWVYCRKAMAPEAVRHLESAVQYAPDDPVSHYHLGMAYVVSGDLERGAKELQTALGLKSDFDGAVEASKALSRLRGR